MKKYRKDEILEYCMGKDVLHLGFIQHSELWREKVKQDDWLHGKIISTARHVVGIDILRDEVEIIKRLLGIEVYYGDATALEKLHLERTFDVIVAGELIEHVSNPGLLLDGVRRFMHKDSVLIITTPNPWRHLWVKNIVEGRSESDWVNSEHVCWYSYQTLRQLMERHAYKEVDYDYYYGESKAKEQLSFSGIIKMTVKKILGICEESKVSRTMYEGLFFVSKT